MTLLALAKVRQEIDKVDTALVHLLDERARLALEVKQAKGQTAPIYQPAREAEVLRRVTTAGEGLLPGPALAVIYKEIIAGCRNLQQPLRVAYLGPQGTYCEEAAHQQFGTTSDYVCFDSITAVVKAADSTTTDIAVVPIENSTEGGVSQTLDLLLNSSLQICGEVMLPIHHQLLSHAGAYSDITEVCAHPQALAQCANWLDRHLPQAIRQPQASNGLAAQLAATKPQLAAIASRGAATRYELPIMARNIEDINGNTTRFIVLGRQATSPTGEDKTSLLCSVPNVSGSLAKLLAILAGEQINLTKLESRPARNAAWDYVFYIDIDGHQMDTAIARVLPKLQAEATYIKILGSYPKAQ
jgi:chorismate mutase/prephenate dehydratase